MRERRLLTFWMAILAAISAAVLAISQSESWALLGSRQPAIYKGRDASQWSSDLRSPADRVRRKAILALNWPGSDGDDPVPLLGELLTSQEEATRLDAVRLLGALAQTSPNAIPVLCNGMSDRSDYIRSQAIFALNTIGPAARDAIPAVIQRLTDESLTVRRQAAFWLGTMEAEARSALPALLKMSRGPNLSLQQTAAAAIWKIDPAAAARERVPSGRSILKPRFVHGPLSGG
jgi:HEAT repeat protein